MLLRSQNRCFSLEDIRPTSVIFSPKNCAAVDSVLQRAASKHLPRKVQYTKGNHVKTPKEATTRVCVEESSSESNSSRHVSHTVEQAFDASKCKMKFGSFRLVLILRLLLVALILVGILLALLGKRTCYWL